VIIIISKIIFFLSLGGLLFIVLKKIPQLSQFPKSSNSHAAKFLFKLNPLNIKGNLKQFIDSNFFQNSILGNLEKSLRKIKILILKIDNVVDKIIRKLKKRSEE